MTLSENKNLIKLFIEEVFNRHNLSAIDKYFDSKMGQGNEKFKLCLNTYFKAFPDMHTRIEHIVAEEDVVVVFLNGTGTHKGEFKGIQPTNRTVNIRSADLYKIQSGYIVEHSDVVDQLNFVQQLGVELLDPSNRKNN